MLLYNTSFEKGVSVQVWKKIALALLVMALAVACSNGSVSSSDGKNRIGCIVVDPDVSQTETVRQTKHFETLRNLSLDGIVAEIEVKTNGNDGIVVESETTRKATDRLRYEPEVNDDSGTLRASLSCKGGQVRLGKLPKLTITIGSRADVRLKSFSGDMALGATAGKFSSENGGAGKVKASDVGSVYIRDGGTVNYTFANVANGLDANLSGSGSLSVSRVMGTMDIHSSGTGNAVVNDGKLSFLELNTSGMGDLTFNGYASQASLYASGIGDITVSSVGSVVYRRSIGTGEISLG